MSSNFGQEYSELWGDALAACQSEEERKYVERLKDLAEEECNEYNMAEVDSTIADLNAINDEILFCIKDALEDSFEEGYVSEYIYLNMRIIN